MTTDTVSSDTLQFALYYAETMKWNVFPVPPGTKMGYSEFAVEHTGRRWGATNDPAEVRRMFELRPEANIGIVCGEVSGIFALDIDTLVGHGKDGFAELAALEAEHGKLPATLQAESPTGSRHDLFKHPGSDFYITSTANKIGLGIDVKGDGGMIIAAPSVTAKGVYRWRNQLPIVDAPEWLLNLVTRKITDEEKRIVRHAPPDDEPTQPPAEIAKLERFVLLALGKNLEWFEDREHALHTVWGIKRAGYGREGYRIADLICSHDAFPETQRVERVNRFWNDRGASAGTVSLASFWKMCADIGIKQTPAEIAAWKNEESRRMFDEIAVKIVAEGEAPLQPGMQNDTPKAKPLRVISAASFAGRPAPEREDLVAGLIPAKIIGGLYGDGAVGKSLLAMMLGVSVTTGRPWLNRIVRKGPVVYVCCEDDEAEVHRRLENICREMGVDMAALSDFHIVPLADEESVLAGSDGRSSVLATTPLYAQLLELTKDVKPQLLIGDTLADIFAGSEVDRMQAKQFVKMMRPLVIPHGGTGLILAHPSLSGMSSGKGTSGSTGWNNSFRWRGYLDKVLDEQDNEADPTHRVLRSKKLNYGPQGGEIELRYQNGCYVLRSNETSMLDPMWRTRRADRVFLDLLRKGIAQNNRVSLQPKGGCYAPTMFRADASKQGVTFAEMKEAMQRLIDSNAIENAPYGAPSKQQFRLYVNS